MTAADHQSQRATRKRLSRPEARRHESRFEARLPLELKQLLERGAALAHQPLSQFVLTSAQRAAEQMIRDHEIISLSERDSQAVLAALRDPGPVNARLAQAAERYKALTDAR